MSDTNGKSPIWMAREAEGLSREKAAQLLDPPVTSKTLERWEKGAKVPRWRIRQLAKAYRTKIGELTKVAA